MPDLFEAKDKAAKAMPKITTDPTLPKGSLGFFTNFRLFPEGITLENQEEDEVIVLFLRRDFITNLPWILIGALLLFLPLALTPIFATFSVSLPGTYVFALNVFYYLLVIGFLLVSFTNWFYNVSIVTTQRVIDLDYANITYKHVGATTIPNVKDVSYIQSGFFRSFFDFGDVRVQTEVEIPNFLFDSVPRPATVVDIVLDLIRGVKKND